MQGRNDKTRTPTIHASELRGLAKEVGSVLSEVNDLHGKEDRAEKYDSSKLETLEAGY